MTKSIITGLMFFVLCSFVSDNDMPKEFSTLLNRAQLTFSKPEEWTETKCISNYQMNYNYALKNKNQEVRYAIQPLDSMVIEYKKAKEKGERTRDPNITSKTIFLTVLLNISMGSEGKPEIKRLDSLSLKNEYNADFGMISIVNLGKDFGGDKYKYCAALMIHKDFIGDVCVFYLSDKKIKVDESVIKLFHSIKFK